METIKKSPNVEFEVIYADGERKRVQEGVLLGVEEDGSIIMHNGTGCAAVWFAAADGMLVAIDACNALPVFVRNRMQDPVSFQALKALSEEVGRRLGKSDEATFRLGRWICRRVQRICWKISQKRSQIVLCLPPSSSLLPWYGI